jgi:hypothetical protein
MYNPCMRTRIPIVFFSVLFALLTLAPYLLASSSAGPYRFTGFLFNPLDGASYLAKMRQGWEGSWQYTLAFTDAPGPGAYLFSYYVLLGHAAKLFGLSLIAVYHAARITGAAVFLMTAWWAFGRFGLTDRARLIAWVTILMGSGFGWAAALAGYASSDLWVAEFVPFLGMLTSAHFPLAMALLMILIVEFTAANTQKFFLRHLAVLTTSAALAILQPFALIPLTLALAAWIIWCRIRNHRFPPGAITKLTVLIAAVAPFALYDSWVTQSLPTFASWSAQNQTPSPPVWDTALALGPLGLTLLIAFGVWIRQKRIASTSHALEDPTPDGLDEKRVFQVLWLASIIVLMYLPISLQRRMMLGALLPIAILAAPVIERWLFAPDLQPRRLLMGLLILPLSNLIVLGAMARAIQTRDAQFFLTANQTAALDWLTMHAAPGDVVLAPPEFSKWIPGFTGLRVVYGHPMETPNAAAALLDVATFYRGDPSAGAIFRAHALRWVYCDAVSSACPASTLSTMQLVWQNQGSQLYQVWKTQ